MRSARKDCVGWEEKRTKDSNLNKHQYLMTSEKMFKRNKQREKKNVTKRKLHQNLENWVFLGCGGYSVKMLDLERGTITMFSLLKVWALGHTDGFQIQTCPLILYDLFKLGV